MNGLETILRDLGGAAMALAAATYLSRQLVRLQIHRSLELHKATLSVHAHARRVVITRVDAQRSAAILSVWRGAMKWREVYLRVTAWNLDIERDPISAVRQ